MHSVRYARRSRVVIRKGVCRANVRTFNLYKEVIPRKYLSNYPGNRVPFEVAFISKQLSRKIFFRFDWTCPAARGKILRSCLSAYIGERNAGQ